MAGGSTPLPPRAPATQQIRGLNAVVVLASPPQTHLIEDTRIRMGDLREAGDQKCILVVERLWAIVGLTSEFFYFSDQIFLDSSLSLLVSSSLPRPGPGVSGPPTSPLLLSGLSGHGFSRIELCHQLPPFSCGTFSV